MFKRIEIKHFRTCEHMVLEDIGNVLALLGRNGAGKTNILIAISIAARAAVSNDSAKLSQLPSISFEIVLGGETYVYAFNFERRMQEGSEQSPKVTFYLFESLSLAKDAGSPVTLVTRENEEVHITSMPNRNPLRIGMPTPMLPALKALLPPEDEILSHVDAVYRFLNAVRYYGIETGEPPAGTGSISIVKGEDYRKWLEQSDSIDDVNQPTLMRLVRLWNEDPDRFDELEKLVGERLGIINRIVVTSATIDRAGGPNDADFYTISFVPARASRSVGLEGLSHGTHRILTMVMSFLLDESSVYLIEQPEDGIHAGLTEKLIGLLRAYTNPAQVILATHSTVLLNQLHPDEVRLVTIDGGKTAVRSLNDNERSVAQKYLTEDGTLSEFLSLVEEG